MYIGSHSAHDLHSEMWNFGTNCYSDDAICRYNMSLENTQNNLVHLGVGKLWLGFLKYKDDIAPVWRLFLFTTCWFSCIKNVHRKWKKTYLSHLSVGNSCVDPTWPMKVIEVQVLICLLPPRGHCRTLQEGRRVITSNIVLLSHRLYHDHPHVFISYILCLYIIVQLIFLCEVTC